MKCFVAVSRCLLVKSEAQEATFHFKGVYLGQKIDCIKVKFRGSCPFKKDEDYILYIGLSENLYDRFQQHLDNQEKTSPTKEGKAVWFYYLTYKVDNLPKLERTWLNQFNSNNGRHPILNKMNSPIS